ncbi:MAG: HEAT repeat domain-containing protein [Halobellus sp.]
MSDAALPGGLQIGNVPTWIVGVAAIVLGSLLLAMALLTVGYSLVQYRRRRRREATREALRPELLDRLYGPDDPDWDAWVETLSARERTAVESLLDEYLRQLSGSDAAELAALGSALGIPERARRRLKRGNTYSRLHALTWLGLLRDPPTLDVLERHCTGTPRERAAAVRVLYQSGHPELADRGVDLLLRGTAEEFSVFGIDTLYRAAESDPGPLFDRAAADWSEWPPALLQQVLLVVRHLNTVVGGADLSWVVAALENPEERTRIEAARALGGYGWRRSLRDDIDAEALADDPSPRVRASVYRMLGAWGDREAMSTLAAVAAREDDDRARVAAAEALVPHRDRHAVAPPPNLAAAWSWATAHASFDEIATDVSREHSR